MIIHLVRHTAVDVKPGLCYGQTDVPLKVSFTQEAEAVKKRIADLEYDAVFTSPLSRCTRLAHHCGFTDAIKDDRIKEMNFGDWEATFLYEMDEPEVRNWFRNQLETPTPNGESIYQMRDRFLGFLQEKQREGLQRILIFAHGGIILGAELLLGKRIDGDPYEHLHPYGTVITLDMAPALRG